jgi:pimeloyl-ACP methyl ester carboxylesterase
MVAAMTISHSLAIPTSFGDVSVTADERGTGRPVVILHGGAGIVPTHPGFGGTPRPDSLTTIGALAEVYAGLLDTLDLADATVIGNSMGGWVAAELALRHPVGLGRFVLVDAVGIEVAGHPVAANLAPTRLAEYSWYDPSKAPSLDPSALPPALREIFAGNRAALAVYGGSMADPSLLGRLADVDVPALVLWGEADRIADADYGRAFAAAIPGARFELLPQTGHVPQLETPDVLLEALRAFVIGGQVTA